MDFSAGPEVCEINSSLPAVGQRIPPITTGREADFGVTIRLAPKLRSSRFTRSPTSSMAPSMAVATADPSATAPIAMAFRRGARRIDWPTNRRNNSTTPADEMPGARQQLAGRDHELPALDARFERNRVAAPLLTDSRNVDGGSAVLANHVAAILIVALASANLAGVKRHSDGLIGPLDRDDTDGCTIRLDRKTVQHPVAHQADWNADHAFRYRERHGCRKLGRRFGVNELRRDGQHEQGRSRAGRQHPHPLAPRRPFRLAQSRSYKIAGLRRATATPLH